MIPNNPSKSECMMSTHPAPDSGTVTAALIRGAFGRRFQVSGLTAAEASALAMQFNRASPK